MPSYPDYRTALAFGLLAAAPMIARAGDLNASVSAVVAPQGAGYLYNYTVTNLSSSIVNLGAFDFEISPNATLTDITLPAGYLDDYTFGNSAVEFASTDAADDIRPGHSDVFYFTADVAPASGSYLARSYDEFQPPATSGGTTSTPTADVPEPAAIGLLALGSIALLRRRSPRSAR